MTEESIMEDVTVPALGTETTLRCRIFGHKWKHYVFHAGRIDFCTRSGCCYTRDRGSVNTIRYD